VAALYGPQCMHATLNTLRLPNNTRVTTLSAMGQLMQLNWTTVWGHSQRCTYNNVGNDSRSKIRCRISIVFIAHMRNRESRSHAMANCFSVCAKKFVPNVHETYSLIRTQNFVKISFLKQFVSNVNSQILDSAHSH